jgi:tRNA(fMet)-specific endonuclease VapC
VEQIVIDTSVLVQLARTNQEQPNDSFADYDVLIPTVVIAEFKAGLELMPKSRRQAMQLQVLDEVCRESQILDFGSREATQFAIFDALLVSSGLRISEFDLAIAAHAAIKQAPILTLDKKAQFDFLPGINVREF